ncbi:YqeB family protein [Streptantibioticus cattleyicolor]|uniref:Uncharacterized protein n=1 Tax=Streptantibioticus cattleyicolor (strain ATCC 35852 / DSM 46488 / JCM 4925 / NBRC 14057 / NRRL 8057) TaxID=1003195 RepID=F8JL26_STREN|nr:hypothetical protein [Streptantibioticus cattleyicolor]AEW98394.1 hypothetical protein SCATT_p02010 [Streptantibioticus cattleyicolor NRRL 8057 = DSM 46488]CCB72546.1 conserved protein of unknown function [Streptantibioticus cattleyicolor NRRL 8057 = DSM 46488]
METTPVRGRDDGRLTVLGAPGWGSVCVCVVFALVGAGTGRLLGPLAHWLVTLPWAPMQGPARLVAALPAPVLYAVGAVAGLALGLVARHEQLVIRLTGDHVVLSRKGRQHGFARDAVATVFRDGKDLVLLGHDGGELARQACDIDANRVADAFAAHGYRWAKSDPHGDRFRRWVPGTPGLPAGADALLKARQTALDKKGPTADEAGELRDELARLGVVVRDEKRRQYWRPLRAEGEPS